MTPSQSNNKAYSKVDLSVESTSSVADDIALSGCDGMIRTVFLKAKRCVLVAEVPTWNAYDTRQD